jgi:hypothetical protein
MAGKEKLSSSSPSPLDLPDPDREFRFRNASDFFCFFVSRLANFVELEVVSDMVST